MPGYLTVRLTVASAALVLVVAQEMPGLAEPVRANGANGEEPKADTETKSLHPSADDTCRTLVRAAADNDLPVELFTRLIWQESRFNPDVVSKKGAQGIAQFMPRTASERGLIDPFEPLLAIRESASYLRELRTTFGGNLGLAVAAYNAGPGRVEAWLAGRRHLPVETHAHVRIVTGHTAQAWASQPPPQWQASDIPKGAPCAELAKLITLNQLRPETIAFRPEWGPWGVQLAGNWSEGHVLATYEQLRRKYAPVLRNRQPLILHARFLGGRAAVKHIVRVSESSRANADALCAKLRIEGGACIVLRNPLRQMAEKRRAVDQRCAPAGDTCRGRGPSAN